MVLGALLGLLADLVMALSSGATRGGAMRRQALTCVLPAPSQYRRGFSWYEPDRGPGLTTRPSLTSRLRAFRQVSLLAPTSSPSSKDARLAEITAAGSGFVYAASLMGVTGTRESVGAQAEDLVRRTRATTDTPVCVGLGVSNAAQAAEVAGFADGVIVGSAFVKRMLDAPDDAAGIEGVRALAADLAKGVRGQA